MVGQLAAFIWLITRLVQLNQKLSALSVAMNRIGDVASETAEHSLVPILDGASRISENLGIMSSGAKAIEQKLNRFAAPRPGPTEALKLLDQVEAMVEIASNFSKVGDPPSMPTKAVVASEMPVTK